LTLRFLNESCAHMHTCTHAHMHTCTHALDVGAVELEDSTDWWMMQPQPSTQNLQQDKGEVELEDFTDWWIMLQSNLFTDEQQRVALPLEAAKAIMIHHPTIELEPCRCDELFDKIDMDGDTLVDYEDLFRAVTNRRRNGDVLSNALAVELGFAEEEGQAFDMEEFRAGWNILDSLEQGRIDIDQFRGYYAKDSKSHREKDGDENDGEGRDEAPSPMEVWAARTDPGSFAIHEASFRNSAPITDTAVMQFRRGITDSRGTFINSPHAKTPKENDSQHGAFRGRDLITPADSFKASFRAPSRSNSFLFRATTSAHATTPRYLSYVFRASALWLQMLAKPLTCHFFVFAQERPGVHHELSDGQGDRKGTFKEGRPGGESNFLTAPAVYRRCDGRGEGRGAGQWTGAGRSLQEDGGRAVEISKGSEKGTEAVLCPEYRRRPVKEAGPLGQADPQEDAEQVIGQAQRKRKRKHRQLVEVTSEHVVGRRDPQTWRFGPQVIIEAGRLA
jgi:hypothetical protein